MKTRRVSKLFSLCASIFLVLVFVLTNVLLASKQAAFAASAPNIVSYQGRLLNANGVPLADASVSMIFELYDSLSGGTCVWSNSSATCASATARSVTLTQGLFSENLGDTGASYAAISDSIFGNNAAVYLQVTVGGETLTPRKQITAAPYALNSDTLDGMDADSDGATATAIVAFDANGNLQVTGSPQGTGVGQGSLYINPASGDVSAGETIFGVAISGTELMSIAEDGTLTVASTSPSILLDDASQDSYSINVGDYVFDLTSANLSADFLAIDSDAMTYTIGDINGLQTTIGNLDSNTTLALLGGDEWNIDAAGVLTLSATTAQMTAIDASDDDYDYALSAGDNDIVGGIGGFYFANFQFTSAGVQVTPGAGFDTLSGGALLIGNTNATSISLCNSAPCDAVTIATNADADAVSIGDSLDTLALASSTWSVASTGVLTLSATSSQTTGIVLTDTDYTNALSVGDNNIIGTTANIDFTNFDVFGSTGNVTMGGDLVVNGGNINFGATTTIGDGTQFILIDSDGAINIADNVINLTGAGGKAIQSQSGTDLGLSGGATLALSSGTGSNITLQTASVNDLFQFYVGNIKLGTGSPNVTLNGNDAYIGGTFEVGSDAYFDGNLRVGNGTPNVALINESAYVEGTLEVGNVSRFYDMMTITANAISDATTTPTGQALVIDVNESQNNDESILIRSSANGTPDAEFRFENDGDAFADGSWTGGGADFAEYFKTTDQGLAAGHPVCTDSTTSESVKRCGLGDTHVIGVISSSPAFIGNSGGAENNRNLDPNYRLVGLTGQVDTLVTAADGAIAIGDPIAVSSVTLGYAGKASGPSRIIGFALEPLAAGQGTIKVLVDPQWHGESVAAVGTGDVILSPVALATASETAEDSSSLRLVGSSWNGVSADEVEMTLKTTVSGGSARLSFGNDAGSEIAAFSSAGDFFLAGKLYPSDRGMAQDSAYIYYDSSAGPGYMKTNAAGWSVGSYDFAEMFPSDDLLQPGDVVVFGGKNESIAKSTGAQYDGKIAGVVSTRPGFLAGDYIAGNYPVALAGRVPTKVSAENGAITVGDPLTTSSIPGVAMKATTSGMILGYAMESLDAGEGTVIAFIRPSYYAGTGGNAAPGAQNTVSGVLGSSFNSLDIAGTLNMNGGTILSVGSLEGVGGNWKLLENGDLLTKGHLIEQVRSYTGDLVNTYASTSTSPTVQLSGTVMLHMGEATVDFDQIDPTFNDIISTTAPYRVFVTPAGVTGQVYVTNRSNGGFIIRDTGNSDAVAIDWMVVAYEKDHEPVMVEAPIVEEPEDVPPEEVVVEAPEDEPVDEPVVADETLETEPEGEVAGDTVAEPEEEPAEPVVEPETETEAPPEEPAP